MNLGYVFKYCNVVLLQYLHKKEEFMKRVFAVAMTDSVHFIHSPMAFKELVKVMCVSF